MKIVTNLSKKIVRSYKNLTDKKHYIEFLTAVLSIPVLITVIILNVNTLKTTNKSSMSPTPVQSKQEKIYIPVLSNNPQANKAKTDNTAIVPVRSGSAAPTSGQCKPDVGPAAIESPTEGAEVTDNPVEVIVAYESGEYCSAVWSYRINNSQWSEYDDKSIALYNMPQGDVKMEIRVKSIVSGREKNLTRNFIYNGRSSGSSTELNNTNSSSASASQTVK